MIIKNNLYFKEMASLKFCIETIEGVHGVGTLSDT